METTALMEHFEEHKRTHNFQLLADVDLVLDITSTGEDITCGYYLANHADRCIFWFDSFDASWEFTEVRGTLRDSHISTSKLSLRSHECSIYGHRTRDGGPILVRSMFSGKSHYSFLCDNDRN